MSDRTLTPTPARHRFFPLLPILFLGVLLRFPALSVQGALNGLLLWFNVVLPTLAPFIVCTQMIVSLGGVNLLMAPVNPLFRRLFRLSGSGAYVLFCGLLCGYPLGAKMCADFKQNGSLTEAEAKYLLAICNHPSPMFLLGYVQKQLSLSSSLLLPLCLYLPVLPLSLLARQIYRPVSPAKRTSAAVKTDHPLKPSLEDTIASTCETMVIIGGYIMLFSILAVWIQQLAPISADFKAMLTGLAEITTGVNSLCASLPPKEALSLTVCTVAFGGFSGLFQTKSVIKGSGLSVWHYLGWKSLHACLSAICLFFFTSLLPG